MIPRRHGLRIQIDVDDVTAQFRLKFIELVNEQFGKSLELKDCTSTYEVEKAAGLTRPQNNKIWTYINKKGFANSLEPMPGAVEYIDMLAMRNDVYFLTSPLKSSETWTSDRTRWIRKHFGVNLSKKLIFTKMKHTVDSDVLIEDNLVLLNDWAVDRAERSPQRTHYPMVYAWPYNAQGVGLTLPRFMSWKLIAGALGC